MKTIYTIGHSTHTTDGFLRLLQLHSITVVADVRSSPYSRFNPQFNRETLEINEAAEKRLMAQVKIPEIELFATPDELIERAYDIP